MVKIDDETRIARYGTKTGLFTEDEIRAFEEQDEREASEAVAEPAAGDINQSFDQLHVNIPNYLSPWLASLRRGVLVDAKDKTGSWYQVIGALVIHID